MLLLNEQQNTLYYMVFLQFEIDIIETGLSCLFTHNEPRNDLQLTS